MKMLPTPIHRLARGGFTLIEMLLALALVGILFGAMTFLLGTVSLLWLGSKDQNFFPQHVDGVTLFLSESLRRAETADSMPGASRQQAGGANPQSLPVEWARPPGWPEIRDPLLLFRQREAPALFVREGDPLPSVNCYLYWDDRNGLSILWYSDLEMDIDLPEHLHRTLVSPYVTRIEYCYYDEENDSWDVREAPERSTDDRNIFLLPQFLKLTFTYQDETFVRNIFLPQRSTDAPLF